MLIPRWAMALPIHGKTDRRHLKIKDTMKVIQAATVRGLLALIAGALSVVICSSFAWSNSTSAIATIPSNTTPSMSIAALAGIHARVLITQCIDESNLHTLKGNTRREAILENDNGPVADDLPLGHMLLQLQRPPELEKSFQQFIEELHDPASPNYHKWLTAQQVGQAFGLAQQDLDTITNWLHTHGFTVNTVYPSGMLIDFSGTADQVREAFHTEIHYLVVNGVRHIANISDPQIPVALAPAIMGVVSLHDFRPHRPTVHSAYTFTSSGYTNQAVVPADLATIYNLNPLFNGGISGQGQTIVVLEDSDVYTTEDWTKFRSTFGLSSYTSGTFTQVQPAPPGGSNNCKDPGVNSGDGEAILDAEYASAAAPSANIVLASCADTATTFGGLIALQNLINGSSTPPAIMSISYGECEAQNGATANAAYNSTYQQAVAEGVSVFVCAGDQGGAYCNESGRDATYGIGVNAYASTPYNVAVGGTDFGDTYAGTNSTYWNSTNSPTYGSALSYIPEIPWNDSCASVLSSTSYGYSTTYGSNGFCDSTTSKTDGFLDNTAGSGGPSGCATGVPSTSGVVSGSCAGYAKPSWQSVVGNPDDGVRDIPDVSLFAADGIWGHYYVVCYSDKANGGAPCTGEPSTWSGFGGTSFATPIMASIQALVNQNVGARQGNPNPVYYQLAATEYGQSGNSSCNSSLGNQVDSSCIFYDITQGDMDIPCTGGYDCYTPSGKYGVLSTSNNTYSIAFGATTGWDFATGIGSVNAYNLVSNWPVDLEVSGAPTIGTATAGNAQATVSFTAPASNGGSAITSYTATSSPGGVTGTGTASPITVTGLTNGTTYTFTVTATNSVGTSLPSSASNSVTPITIPGAPTIGAATAGNAQAMVAFTPTPPASNVGSPITGYTATSNPGSFTGTGTTSPITVSGLTNGTVYTFTVTATNAAGTGPPSGISNRVTPKPSAISFVSGPHGKITGTNKQLVNYGGSTTQVTAVPATGYYFVNWTGTNGFVTTTANPLIVTDVTVSQTITANFTINQYVLNFNAGAGGTITGTTPQTVNYGGSATKVSANPETGYHFVNWTGDNGFATSKTNPLNVKNVKADHNITANFAINQYTMTFAAGLHGSITGTKKQTVNYGGSTTEVTATHTTGYHFVKWTGTKGFLTTTDNPLTVTDVSASQAVTANFSK